MHTVDSTCELSEVRTHKRDIVIPKGQSITVSCWANIDQCEGQFPPIFLPC